LERGVLEKLGHQLLLVTLVQIQRFFQPLHWGEVAGEDLTKMELLEVLAGEAEKKTLLAAHSQVVLERLGKATMAAMESGGQEVQEAHTMPVVEEVLVLLEQTQRSLQMLEVTVAQDYLPRFLEHYIFTQEVEAERKPMEAEELVEMVDLVEEAEVLEELVGQVALGAL
jgi:hypothetical protein